MDVTRIAQNNIYYYYRYGLESTVTAVNVDESFAQMPSVLSTRSEEKQEMSVLNNRFATYIDKVRRLETQNKILQTKMIEVDCNITQTTIFFLEFW